MATTNISIRIDENLKKEGEELFADLGLTMSSAFIAFVKQSVREQRIPFILSRAVPNPLTIQAIEDVKNNVNVSKSFNSVKDLMDDLNNKEID